MSEQQPFSHDHRRRESAPMAAWVFFGLVCSALIIAGAVFAAITYQQTHSQSPDDASGLQGAVEDLTKKVDALTIPSPVTSVVPTVTTTPVLSPTPELPALLDVTNIEVGDVIANLTVQSVKPLDSSAVFSQKNAAVAFRGEFQIEGIYEHFPAGSFFGDKICVLDLTEASQDAIPMFVRPSDVVVCFANDSTATALYGPVGSKGRTTATVNNLQLEFSKVGVSHTATLLHGVKQ